MVVSFNTVLGTLDKRHVEGYLKHSHKHRRKHSCETYLETYLLKSHSCRVDIKLDSGFELFLASSLRVPIF